MRGGEGEREGEVLSCYWGSDGFGVSQPLVVQRDQFHPSLAAFSKRLAISFVGDSPYLLELSLIASIHLLFLCNTSSSFPTVEVFSYRLGNDFLFLWFLIIDNWAIWSTIALGMELWMLMLGLVVGILLNLLSFWGINFIIGFVAFIQGLGGSLLLYHD